MTLASILEDLDAVSDTIAIVAIGGSGFYFVKGVLGSSSEGSGVAGASRRSSPIETASAIGLPGRAS
jgi:hypothetical protein